MRVMVYGFVYSATSVDAVADGLATAGAKPVAWMLHNNHVPRFGAQLASAGIEAVAELLWTGVLTDRARWSAPSRSARAAPHEPLLRPRSCCTTVLELWP